MIGEIARYFSKAKGIIICGACVGVVAHMGRSYFRINPSQAVLFNFAHNIIYRIGLALLVKWELVEMENGQERKQFASFSRSEAFARRAAFLTFTHIPHALAIISGVLSPLQVMAILGLGTLTDTFTGPLFLFPTKWSVE